MSNFTPEQQAKLNEGMQPVRVFGTPPPPSVLPQPETPPAYIRLISKFRKPGEIGPGDTFERLASTPGKLYQQVVKDCNCPQRKAEWNKKWAYEKES